MHLEIYGFLCIFAVTLRRRVWIETLEKRDFPQFPEASPSAGGCGLKLPLYLRRLNLTVRHPPQEGVD